MFFGHTLDNRQDEIVHTFQLIQTGLSELTINTVYIDDAVVTRYIRLYANTYHWECSFRFEILGCLGKHDNLRSHSYHSSFKNPSRLTRSYETYVIAIQFS